MLNINRIDLNLFIVFNAIYTERGITRAGDSLKLSQPAISHSLARLRELIGDPLFIREGNSVTSTPVADHLIGPVRKALREIERSLLQLSEFTPELSPLEFRIGMSLVLESLTMPLLVDTIKDIRFLSAHLAYLERQTGKSPAPETSRVLKTLKLDVP